MNKFLIVFALSFLSCDAGKLNIITDLPKSLEENSAIETVKNSDLLWTIEDSGNKNNLYGLNTKGKIIKDIDITNSKNIDWEDLTTDEKGNIYIGDFGNNSRNRDNFTIYKVSDLSRYKTSAEKIKFLLPKKVKSKNFEAFFLLNDYFYLFSKDNKSSTIFKVPNRSGKHVAKKIFKFNFSTITSADISDDGKKIVLLTHDKLWMISGFGKDDFLNAKIETFEFEYKSQKEGVCFKDNNSVYITDELNKSEGGNLYEFELN